MSEKTRQLFGIWRSPLSAAHVMGELRLNDVAWDTESKTLVWSEGKGVLKAQSGIDAPIELTNGEGTARGRVGYGGGEMAAAGGYVYFTAKRLHKVPVTGGRIRNLTPEFGGLASPAVSPDGKWVVYVYSYERKDGLGVVDSDGKLWPRKLFSGTNFVMQPVWHPSGDYLAFISWDHPNMPWDGTELRLAAIAHDETGMPYIDSIETVAGARAQAIFQPEFSPDGRYLSFISDETGYGQLYVYDLSEKQATRITTEAAEHGMPAWVQGMRTYAWTPNGQNICFLRNRRGFVSLHSYSLEVGAERVIKGLDEYTYLKQISISPGGQISLIASSARIAPRIISFDPDSNQTLIHQRSSAANIAVDDLADVQAVEWAGHDGEGEAVHGLYYPPSSRRYDGVGAPPLIVIIHGGPTSQAFAEYDATAQFFATRGFAVLNVNHRGSTGYGREYMQKLRGNWGVYDVEDAASGAQYLASQGLADRQKLVIMGGSAGGYTVLQSLINNPGLYAAGICRYGVANLFSMVQDTHKFEERYNDSLVGALPEAIDIYRERSPEFHAEKIQDPIVIFQGAEDTVVSRSQSDGIVAALKTSGTPHEYHVYEGEGHGFRKPETLEHYYKTMLEFLQKYVIYT